MFGGGDASPLPILSVPGMFDSLGVKVPCPT